MPLPDFKGHKFQYVGAGKSRCIHCALTVRETFDGYQISMPGMYAAVSKKGGLAGNTAILNCEPR